MPTFYNVSFSIRDWEFKRKQINMKFFDFTNACAYAEEISGCADVEDSTVNVVDGTTGEIVATFELELQTYGNF